MKMDPEERRTPRGGGRPGLQPDQELALAVTSGRWSRVYDLIESGAADIHAEDDLALRTAAENGLADHARWLIDHGANPNAKKCYALYEAMRNGNTETARLLVERGANVTSTCARMRKLDRDDLADKLLETVEDILERRRREQFERNRRTIRRRGIRRLR